MLRWTGRTNITDQNPRGDYVRFMKNIDLTTDCDKFVTIFSDVLKNTAVRVILDKTPEEESEVAKMIDTLREKQQIHFVV